MRTMHIDEAVDLIRATVGTDQTTRTDPEVAADSIAVELERLRAVEAAAREFADSVGIDIGHEGWARYRRLRKSLGLPDR